MRINFHTYPTMWFILVFAFLNCFVCALCACMQKVLGCVSCCLLLCLAWGVGTTLFLAGVVGRHSSSSSSFHGRAGALFFPILLNLLPIVCVVQMNRQETGRTTSSGAGWDKH